MQIESPHLAAMLYNARDLTLGRAIVKAGKDNSDLEKTALQMIPAALCPWHYFSGIDPAGRAYAQPLSRALQPAEPLTAAIKLLLPVFLPRSVNALMSNLSSTQHLYPEFASS